MLVVQSWRVDAGKILTRRELAAVLTDLNARAPRSVQVRLNRVIFRLACCCGLRVSEIANLRLEDVRLDLPRPHLRLRKETTKGGRARRVPLWWDAGTLADLTAWKSERIAHWALRPEAGGDPLVPEEVYAAGQRVQLPKWQGWARAARAKIDELLGAVA